MLGIKITLVFILFICVTISVYDIFRKLQLKIEEEKIQLFLKKNEISSSKDFNALIKLIKLKFFEYDINTIKQKDRTSGLYICSIQFAKNNKIIHTETFMIK